MGFYRQNDELRPVFCSFGNFLRRSLEVDGFIAAGRELDYGELDCAFERRCHCSRVGRN